MVRILSYLNNQELVDGIHAAIPNAEIIFIDPNKPLEENLEADCLLCVASFLDGVDQVIAATNGLKWIHVFGTGIDGLPIEALGDIILTSARGASAVQVAEWAFTCILAARKNLPENWISAPSPFWSIADNIGAVQGQTLSIFGFGSIGKELAKRAFAFDMKVLTMTRQSSVFVDRVETTDSLEVLFAKADHLVLAAPATTETENYMPLALDISHKMMIELAKLRRENKELTYLRPDAKSQVTIEYSDDNVPQRIVAIVLSTQHDQFMEDDEKMLQQIKEDIINILMPRVIAQLPEYVQKLFNDDITYHINPTGKFVIGGPHGDAGLTGRKIIVDTYGGKGAHGGGAFSGKDPSKVDRSAAYASRHIAKNLVAAGVADEVLVQVSYAIGVAEPTSVFVDTYGSSKVDLSNGEIALKVKEVFDMRPAAIEERLKLRNPIYRETAAYGHMGKEPKTITKIFESPYSGKITKEVELFTWETLDYVEKVKDVFNL